MIRTIIYISVVLLISGCTTTKEEPKWLLSDPKATTETSGLYHKLHLLAQKGIMTGHQDALSYGLDWIDEEGRCDVYEATGDYPGVFGWDLGHIELGNDKNLDGVPFEKIRKHAIDVYNLGGVNTFSWHANNPYTSKNSWDISSSSVVKSILKGGTNHSKFNSWLEVLGNYFLSLKTEEGVLIPVIFRPYHEHTGNWFWWCQNVCTVDEYKDLWKYTVTYLRNKGVHNLIMAYSSSGCDDSSCFLERYPGDEFVDLLGYDDYHVNISNDDFKNQVSKRMDIIAKIAGERKKLLALTEVGLEGLTEKKWFTEVIVPALKNKNVSYFLLWRNFDDRKGLFYAPYPGHHSADNYKEMVSLEHVFSLKEIGDVYNKSTKN